MANQKLIRRTMLAAAITVSAANTTETLGFQQGQYQPGQPGQQIPQGSSAVTQELNRMFQESGQQIPSMNPQDLPNANAPIQGQVRPRLPQNPMLHGTNQKSPNSKQASGSEKPSFISRFFGKLRGASHGSASQNNQNYRPPVPPNETNELQSSTIPGANSFQSAVQSPLPTQNPSSPSAAGQRPTYIQPGSAPGFMSTTDASTVIKKQPAATPPVTDEFHDDFILENGGGPVAARLRRESVKPKTPAASVSVPKNVDEFENPFPDSTDSVKPSELLDLDSLIEIPRATPQQIKANVRKTIPDAPTAASSEVPVSTPPQSVVSDQLFDDQEAEEKEKEKETQADDNVAEPEENPFTGVQLEMPNGQSPREKDYLNSVDTELFETPAAPTEDFNPNLPAIDLPPVGEADSLETDEIKPAPVQKVSQLEVESTVESPANDSTNIESQPSVDVPEALIAADTERLRQTAEEERRQRQHRQILARAGQTGFKGFCPVPLRERRELVEASPQFTSTFGLQTYTFSSAESKVAFDRDPARYAPVAGGSDIVVLVNSGEEQAGQLDFALWYRDRLYWFCSGETMTLFSKDPQRFASQY